MLTPGGRGAIAVVAVAGDGALAAVDANFLAASGRPLAELPLGRIAFGRWGNERGEEVVVTRLAHRIEVHCHGGIAASRAILDSLNASGCETCTPETLLGEEYADAIAAAAHQALAEAATEKAALVLVDQLNGALSDKFRRLADLIPHDATAAGSAVSQLLERWQRVGRRLTSPMRVVLTGPPNVGKSSLINALVGYQRAIVFDTPGTTRDAVTATTAIEGWAVELVDTAGLRSEATGVEQAGIALAERLVAEADLVVQVREAKTVLDFDSPDDAFPAVPTDRSVIHLANKYDLISPDERTLLPQSAGEPLVLASATSRGGTEALLDAMGRIVVPPELPPGTPVPFTPEQAARLERVGQLLNDHNTAAARDALLAMLQSTL